MTNPKVTKLKKRNGDRDSKSFFDRKLSAPRYAPSTDSFAKAASAECYAQDLHSGKIFIGDDEGAEQWRDYVEEAHGIRPIDTEKKTQLMLLARECGLARVLRSNIHDIYAHGRDIHNPFGSWPDCSSREPAFLSHDSGSTST